MQGLVVQAQILWIDSLRLLSCWSWQKWCYCTDLKFPRLFPLKRSRSKNRSETLSYVPPSRTTISTQSNLTLIVYKVFNDVAFSEWIRICTAQRVRAYDTNLLKIPSLNHINASTELVMTSAFTEWNRFSEQYHNMYMTYVKKGPIIYKSDTNCCTVEALEPKRFRIIYTQNTAPKHKWQYWGNVWTGNHHKNHGASDYVFNL